MDEFFDERIDGWLCWLLDLDDLAAGRLNC